MYKNIVLVSVMLGCAGEVSESRREGLEFRNPRPFVIPPGIKRFPPQVKEFPDDGWGGPWPWCETDGDLRIAGSVDPDPGARYPAANDVFQAGEQDAAFTSFTIMVSGESAVITALTFKIECVDSEMDRIEGDLIENVTLSHQGGFGGGGGVEMLDDGTVRADFGGLVISSEWDEVVAVLVDLAPSSEVSGAHCTLTLPADDDSIEAHGAETNETFCGDHLDFFSNGNADIFAGGDRTDDTDGDIIRNHTVASTSVTLIGRDWPSDPVYTAPSPEAEVGRFTVATEVSASGASAGVEEVVIYAFSEFEYSPRGEVARLYADEVNPDNLLAEIELEGVEWYLDPGYAMGRFIIEEDNLPIVEAGSSATFIVTLDVSEAGYGDILWVAETDLLWRDMDQDILLILPRDIERGEDDPPLPVTPAVLIGYVAF